jgi:hypothetical protein
VSLHGKIGGGLATAALPHRPGTGRRLQWATRLQAYGVTAAAIVLVVIVSVGNPAFLSPINLSNMLSQWAPAGIMCARSSSNERGSEGGKVNHAHFPNQHADSLADMDALDLPACRLYRRWRSDRDGIGGLPYHEPDLFRLGYAFEEATHHRKAPIST